MNAGEVFARSRVSGINPKSGDFIDKFSQMADMLEKAQNARVDYETKMEQIETRIREWSGGCELNNAIYDFACVWVESGKIKDLRIKMFGLYGDGGYWHEPKIQREMKMEPNLYGLIVGHLLQGFDEKSASGNLYSVDVFQSLLKSYSDVAKAGPMQEIGQELMGLMVEMVSKVGERHPSIRAKIVATGIELTNLTDFKSLPELEQDGLAKNIVDALIEPKTPQK